MLCLVIDRGALCTALEAALEAAVAGGVDWVQIRERGLEGEALARLIERVRAACQRAARPDAHPKLIVNRYCDVALACGADGVHLGFDAVPPRVARALLGPGALVGASVHAPDEIRADTGLSYVHLAPIFPPLSKTSEREPLGLAGVRAAAGRGIPVLAQGGVDADNAAAIRAAGAAGVAVTGAILMRGDPERASRALRRGLDG